MKLEITFGRDTDGDWSADITLTLGNHSYVLGVYAMATDHTLLAALEPPQLRVTVPPRSNGTRFSRGTHH